MIDPPLSPISEYLAFALYKQGNLKQALITTDRLYELGLFICLLQINKVSHLPNSAPAHPRAKGNIKWQAAEIN
jgi:hypothetical protein